MAENTTLTIQLSAKDDASKKIQDAGKKISDVAKGIGETVKKVGAISAASIAGISAFAFNSVKELGGVAEALTNMSKSTGLSIQSLSALKYAADQTSVPLDTMTLGIKKLQLSQSDLKGFSADLKDIGLNAKDIQKLSIEDQFFKIGNAIAQLPSATDRTIESMKFFGKAGTDLLPIFGKGAETLGDWTAAAKKAGVLLNEETAQAAVNADGKFDDLEQVIKGLSKTITTQLMPAVIAVLDTIIPLIAQVGDWIKKNPELTKTIVEWGGALLVGGAALGAVVKSFELLSVVVKGLGTMSALTSALTGISLLQFGAIAALIVSLKWIYDNWETVANGARKIADNLGLVNSSSGSAGAIKNLQKEMQKVGPTKLEAAPTSSTATGWQTFKGNLDIWNADLRQGLIDNISDSISYITGPGYAKGGRPEVGMPSIVGENGPELFVPDNAGTVVPNHRLGGDTININISGNTLLDNNVAKKLSDMIMGELRLQKRF